MENSENQFIGMSDVDVDDLFQHGIDSSSFSGMFDEEFPNTQASETLNQSSSPNVAVAEPPKKLSAEDWDNIRSVFTELYSTRNITLKEVASILEREYSFVATERMYKTRINNWGLHKNLRRAEKGRLKIGLARTKLQR